jgi:serpin B
LETLNFDVPEQARQRINVWVKKQTRDKIVDLIPSGMLLPSTRLVLTNAIYFEGSWSSEFSKGATKETPFHLTANDKIDVLTMEQREGFPYTEDADAQVLAMPYGGHELSMVVVLPKKVDGLAELEGKLTHDRFTDWTRRLRGGRPVETYLPKFKMRSEFMLSGTLRSMGMTSAFSDSADFSAMSKSEDLMISEVVHQAFVDVDEEGTEAAAATAVLVAPTAAPFEHYEPPKPIIFRADHPFLFVIRDDRTGAVLFMGRVQRPEA